MESEDAADTTAAEDSKSSRAIRWWAANIWRCSSSMWANSALFRSATDGDDTAPPPVAFLVVVADDAGVRSDGAGRRILFFGG